MQNYFDVLRKYAVFSGRARRRENWLFQLVSILVSFVYAFCVTFISAMMNDGHATPGAHTLANLYVLVTLIPAIAVLVRRMHDTYHNGWWAIVPLVNLIFAIRAGDHGDNAYGSDPKVRAEPA